MSGRHATYIVLHPAAGPFTAKELDTQRQLHQAGDKRGLIVSNTDGSFSRQERGEWRCCLCGEMIAEATHGREGAVIVRDGLVRLDDEGGLAVFGLPRRTVAGGRSRRQVKRHALSADWGRVKSTPVPLFAYCPRRDLGCGILLRIG